MKNLIGDFRDSIFSNGIDITADYFELGIDPNMEDGILKDIPIVKTIVSGINITKNIIDWNLLRQTIAFINELNNGTIDEKKLNDYKEKINMNPKKCEKELGRVLIYLNSFIDTEKTQMLARLFKTYICQKISWNEFCEFSEIINRMFITDIELLKHIRNVDKIKGNEGDNFRIQRLSSQGIIGLKFPPEQDDQNILHGIVLSPIGKKLCDIIF